MASTLSASKSNFSIGHSRILLTTNIELTCCINSSYYETCYSRPQDRPHLLVLLAIIIHPRRLSPKLLNHSIHHLLQGPSHNLPLSLHYGKVDIVFLSMWTGLLQLTNAEHFHSMIYL